jgi:hypothetical protein
MAKLFWKLLLLICAVPLVEICSARGAVFPTNEFATQIDAYTQGTVASYDTGYGDTADWTGIPTGTTGAPEGAPGVVTPFYPPFDPSQILVIGNGGNLMLQFPNPVTSGAGYSLGVFSTAGFIDSSGTGTVGSTAATFGGGLVTVQVSADGLHWVSLGTQNIDMPQSYYRNSGPYDVIPPSNPLYSNYGVPYTGGLSAFDNETDAQVLTTLNGSAGGTWLDVSATGLSQIDYIDFTPPADAPANWQIALEAVSTANPILVPEPGGMAWILVGMAVVLKRRSTIEGFRLRIENGR